MANTRFVSRSANKAVLSLPSFYANVPNCFCTSGQFTISRSGGSFILDGIRIGDAVAATSAIPAGSVVTNVNSDQLITIDQPVTATASGLIVRFGTQKSPRLVNGNSLYTSNPSPLIVADDSNLQNVVDPDRFVTATILATTPNDGTDVSIDIDLGSDVSITAVGWGNVDLPGPLTFPTSLLVWGKASSGGYPASFLAAAWTAGQWAAGSFALGGSNVYFTLPAPVSLRYLRYKFLNASFSQAQWSVGYPIAVAAANILDLGMISNPGIVVERRKNVAATRSWSGIQTITDLGGDYRTISLPLRITGAQLNALIQIVTSGKPFLYVDENDFALEVVTSEQRFKYTRIWTDLYDVELEMESLP